MPAREVEELPRIGTGIRGDRADLTLLEQVALVVQRRNIAEVDAGDGQRPAAVEGLKCRWHQITNRGEQDRGVQLDRRRVGGSLRRGGPEGQRQFTGVRPAGHHMHLRPLGQSHLRGDMRAASEPVEPQPSPGWELRTQQ